MWYRKIINDYGLTETGILMVNNSKENKDRVNGAIGLANQSHKMKLLTNKSDEYDQVLGELLVPMEGCYDYISENENKTFSTLDDKKYKKLESNGTVDVKIKEEINSFLETFFKLYLKAREKELSCYVSENALNPIGKDYALWNYLI